MRINASEYSERALPIVRESEGAEGVCACGTRVSLEEPWETPRCWRCELATLQAAAGFYREHQGATLADFPAPIAAEAIRLLEARDQPRGLFVTGPAGTGKTRLLAAIAAAFRERALFGLARAIIRATWDPETQDREIRRLSSVPLLMLDDLGREGRPSEAVCATIHEVLSARNGNYLPTAVTSNFTLEQLAERYDEAIADRLRPWKRIVMAGRSRR